MDKYYCYILKAGPFCKIGHSNNVQRRIETMQTGCPYEITIVCLFAYDIEQTAREMETRLHNRFRRARIRGEWFKYSVVAKKLQTEGPNTPSISKLIDNSKGKMTPRIKKSFDDSRCFHIFELEESANQHMREIVTGISTAT